MVIERPRSGIGAKFAELMQELSQGLIAIMDKLSEAFGYEKEELTEDQTERIEFAARLEQERVSRGGGGVFDDRTHPLRESGEEALDNILNVPDGTEIDGVRIPSFEDKPSQNDSWVKYHGDVHWQDHKGYLIPKPQVRFLIRDGYNPDQDGTIEEFTRARCNPPGGNNKFLGKEIHGGIHPLVKARMELVEEKMDEYGINYSKDGSNTIDKIDGWQYRTMGSKTISKHSLGLCVDFSKNDNNNMTHLTGDRGGKIEDDASMMERYIAETDYSREFYDIMTQFGFLGFGAWVANRRGQRDLMEFRATPDEDGAVPCSFDEEIHRRA